MSPRRVYVGKPSAPNSPPTSGCLGTCILFPFAFMKMQDLLLAGKFNTALHVSGHLHHFSELLSHLESQQPQQLCLFLESSAEQHFVHTSLSSSLKQSLLFFGEVEPENGKNIWILQAVLSLQASVSLAVKMGSITGPSRHHGTVGKIPSLYVKMLCDCKVLQSVYQSFFFFFFLVFVIA